MVDPRSANDNRAVITGILVLIAAACGCLGLAVACEDRSKHAAAISPTDRCRARPVFAELQRASFVLDALIEASDDQTVPIGMPFSLCLVPPDRSDDYLFSQLRDGRAWSSLLRPGGRGPRSAQGPPLRQWMDGSAAGGANEWMALRARLNKEHSVVRTQNWP